VRRMTGSEIRSHFLGFFRERGHRVVESSSLVPAGDPTLLFTNAGMVQFKDVFLGLEKRDYNRATTSQKCVRAGGKHNDLEQVGKTARHHTFFEMLGNFSFGDYFKKEAILYAWELLTDKDAGFGLPPERLTPTIYKDDEEAFAIWRDEVGIPAERIVRLGGKDNFWSMGETGPCGPCTEIIYDRGADRACSAAECAIGKCDCDRWLEVWNLVFMQYDRDEDGAMTPLPRPCVDTGMGLERIASILQEVDSNYETDLFRPLIDWLEDKTRRRCEPGEGGFPFRVIADHARSCTFLIADGVVPSNEFRGYVLRRILRRAARFGRVLGFAEPFLHEMVPLVGAIMGEAYPDVVQRQDYIQKVIRCEEARFLETLNEGTQRAEEMLAAVKDAGGQVLPGKQAFLLYDTFGFPIDLTEDMAAERGLTVDREGFEKAMEEQRRRAREAREAGGEGDEAATASEVFTPDIETEFVGYDELEAETRITALASGGELAEEAGPGDGEIWVILARCPFYAESGGQVADKGVIEGPQGRAEVERAFKLPDGRTVVVARVTEGRLGTGQAVKACVDAARRLATARHHTATHLLHRALRATLGDHAAQAGSLVAPDRLRFDFSHFEPLTGDQVRQVETLVNEAVLAWPRPGHLLFLQGGPGRRGRRPLRGEVRGQGPRGRHRRPQPRTLRRDARLVHRGGRGLQDSR